jgi:hypothetical protein
MKGWEDSMAKPNKDAPLGQGGRFAAVAKAAGGGEKGAAIAAAAGRAKYGNAKMSKMAAAGKKKASGKKGK